MDAQSQRVAQILRDAMTVETNGYHFYTLAARDTRDERGQAVFAQLAQEELAHLKFLRHQYSSVVEGGATDPAVSLGHPERTAASTAVFSDAIRGRLAEAHFEMSALSIAAQLELAAVRFYKAQAEAAGDPVLTRWFRELADWESGHYQALLAQFEALKEDYWAGGGFAPF